MKPAILLVEDDEEMLEFIADDLGEHYQVFKAANGLEALEVLREESIQLVISDVMMDEMDGFELCTTIKNSFELCHLPVILLTAKNSLQSKIEGLELGADAYIEKPFSPEYLQVQIANLLHNRNKIKDYFAKSPLVHIKSIAHSRSDEAFLQKLNEAIFNNLEDENLDVEKLARIMNMSKPSLYRKIKQISDLSANELINLTRLKKAAELLAEGNHKIYEIASIVGYSSQSNFGRNFLKQFGMSPSSFQAMKQAEKKA
jgi:two-component system cell cycle response regulator